MADDQPLGDGYKRRRDILAERGLKTTAALEKLTEALAASDTHSFAPEALLTQLNDGSNDWNDDDVAALVDALTQKIRAGASLDLTTVKAWMSAHPADRRAWAAKCVLVDPPAQVEIVRVLSVAGSQKIVYLARWGVTGREIVLKEFLDEKMAEVAILRELEPHPLSLQHPNIIETHRLTNEAGENFLAERYLRVLTDDTWRGTSAMEAANLLHDLASALAFVHERKLVHGDVKPDNTGYEHPRYILLDFGVCRPASDFTNADPTGTLRTRAPEILAGEAGHSEASDVWALGATVFQGLVGRFPLYESETERTPRIWDDDREAHEQMLAERAATRYQELVVDALDAVGHAELRRMLRWVLARDPAGRPDAAVLAAETRNHLAGLVRAADASSGPSQHARIEQLKKYLPKDEVLDLMPARRRSELAARLHDLLSFPGLSEPEKAVVAELERRVTSES